MSGAPQMQRLDAREAGFDAALDRLLDRLPARDEEVRLIVADIIADVRAQGDQALVEHTRRLDRLPCDDGAVPEIGRAELLAALERIPPALRQAVQAARDRVVTAATTAPGLATPTARLPLAFTIAMRELRGKFNH